MKAGLTEMGIPFVVNPRLVRGLDYYRHTVFEFITDSLGAQGTVLGGGRYDGLVEELGGPKTAGIGFGAGIDRLSLLLQETGKQPAEPRPIAVIPVGDDTLLPIMKIAHDLRQNGFIVDMAYSGNMGKRMKKPIKSMRARPLLWVLTNMKKESSPYGIWIRGIKMKSPRPN